MPESDSTKASLTDVRKFFGYATISEFAKDWKALDEKSQTQIREGIGNETFTY